MPTRLPDIDEVEHMSDADNILLSEVRAVLERHGAQGRFGLTLLHQHFHIDDDEVLVETVDVAARTLTVTPQKSKAYAGLRSIQTQWRLDDCSALQLCTQVCPGPNSEDHNGAPVHQNI